MSRYIVRRLMRLNPVTVLLMSALTACDAGERTAAPLVMSGTDDIAIASRGSFKAAEYTYAGCVTEAEHLSSPLIPPAVFEPPVCIPVTIEFFEDGRWNIDYYPGVFTTPDYPNWTFSIGDFFVWVSSDGKCTGGGDRYLEGPSCVSEPRYRKKMTFSTAFEANGYRTVIRFAYAGKQ
jgi:hypothetical protein